MQSTLRISRTSRIKGALMGAFVGDAFWVRIGITTWMSCGVFTVRSPVTPRRNRGAITRD